MQTKAKSSKNSSISLLVLILLSLTLTGCEVDDKGLIDRVMGSRAAAMSAQDLDAYMALISPDYKYKPTSKQTVREYMEENLMFWDSVHMQTYNRLIYIDKPIARVSQDYNMSVTKNKKTQVLSGAEHFVLKREGWLSPKWQIIEGVD
jgi:hypothetical protein